MSVSRSTNHSEPVYEDVYNDDTIANLENGIRIQESIIQQTLNAIKYCEANKKICQEDQRIEAERILLSACIKKNILKSELETPRPKRTENICASLKISQLTFTRKSIWRNFSEDVDRTVQEYYACVMIHKDEVQISEVVTADQHFSICFAKEFQFDELLLDFVIGLKIYLMRTNQEKEKSCLSPKNFFSRISSRRNSKKNKLEDENLSKFTLLGSADLTIQDLKADNLELTKFGLLNLSHETVLKKAFTFSVRNQLKSLKPLSGFVELARNPHHLDFMKYWCVFNAGVLQFWKNSEDAKYFHPLFRIHLAKDSNCLLKVMPYQFRKRTFYLTMVEEANDEMAYQLKHYYFSFATTDEFNSWKNEIEMTLNTLKCWGLHF